MYFLKQFVLTLLLACAGITAAHAFDSLSAPQDPTEDRCSIEVACPNGKTIGCSAQADAVDCYPSKTGVTCIGAKCFQGVCRDQPPVNVSCK